MNDADLLLRIAATLKQEIAPAIDAEYPKTQAFMAAVVLEKLGRQIALAPAHARASAADLIALIDDLTVMLSASGAPNAVEHAIAELCRTRDAEALGRMVETLYAAGAELGERRFAQLLARVRRTLRADIERRMEYSE
jgi:hypothetical protein